MISLKSLVTEGKRINISIGGEKINFTTMVGRDNKLIFIAASSAELDKLEDIKSYLPKNAIENAISAYLESVLRISFIREPNYPGAGYAFTIDMDTLINKLK